VVCAPDQLQDNSLDFDEPRAEGYFEWLARRANFRRWRDFTDTKVFYLTGNPATGKSFLAKYVIENLTGLSYDCSYYFFKEGDKLKSSLSKSLHSLAYQMAYSNAAIRETILEIRMMTYKSIQSTHEFSFLPIPGHFRRHLLALVSKTNFTFSLCIFTTSRPSLELQSQL
jgi:hypothetical protein